MTVRKLEEKTVCKQCGKAVEFFYPGGLCSVCYSEFSLPDIELAMYYHVIGHTVECSLAMESGGSCFCKGVAQ